jgi:hypothetical protein
MPKNWEDRDRKVVKGHRRKKLNKIYKKRSELVRGKERRTIQREDGAGSR